MRWISLAAAIALLAGCDYDAPLNEGAEAPNGGIVGTITVSGIDEPAYALILMFHSDTPPPPAGTGRPFTFAGVPASAFEETSSGTMSAPFYVSNLPDGDYLMLGLVDVDANFQPLSDVQAGSSCGDVLGGYYTDLNSKQLATVTVTQGELVEGVPIVASNVNRWQRPAFHVVGNPTVSRQYAIDQPADFQTFDIRATGIHSALPYDLDGPMDLAAYDNGTLTDFCDTTFAVTVVDADGNGAADPHPDFPPDSGPIYDIWPRIYVTYLGVPQEDGTFANDLVEGESWAGQMVIDPFLILFGQITPAEFNTQVPFNDLEIYWAPAAVHDQLMSESECTALGGVYTASSGKCRTTITDPAQIPPGAWALSAIQFSGQSWTVPNSTAAYASTDASFDPAKQTQVLIVE